MFAAVATGKVKGGDGSAIRPDVEAAIDALGRFHSDPRVFPLIQGIIDSPLPVDTKELSAEDRYRACLRALSAAGLGKSDAVVNYVSAHVQAARFPWGETALRWLFTENQWDKEKLRALIEEVLSKPGHRAFGEALNLYSDIVEKQVAGARFAAIAGDEKYSAIERKRAKNVRENIFENPFLGLEVREGESSSSDGLTPLETVIFTNISPQEITLPVSSVEELLIIRVVSDKGVVTPLKPIQHKEAGKLTFKPGEHAEIHNVKWWEWLDLAGMNLEGWYDVSFQARTPGLWEVPAKTNWSTIIEGKKFGKVIEAASK